MLCVAAALRESELSIHPNAHREELVLAVPGVGFGGPGHFRISYCIDDRTLAGSLDGLRKTAKRFGLKK